jgi:hypothetical protein
VLIKGINPAKPWRKYFAPARHGIIADPALALESVALCSQFNLGGTWGRCGIARKPYAEDVFRVTPVAGNQLEPAIRVVSPPDTYLFDTVATPLCQVEDFYIEHVSINLLTSKKIVSYLPAEELEAALSVPNVPQTDQAVHDKPESLRAQPSMKRLGNLDDGASHSARAYHNVVPVIKLRQKLFEFLYRRLVIRIYEADDLTLRPTYRFSDTTPFPSAFGCPHDPDPRIFGSQQGNRLTRAVVAIGGYPKLIRVASVCAIALDRFDCLSYDVRFVIGGKNHT